MQVQKQQFELDMEQQACSKSGKEYVKALYCHPTGLDEAQAGIKISGRNINNLTYADDTTLMAEKATMSSSRGSSQFRDWTIISYISCFI